MNGEQLVRLLVENDIGVHRTSYDLIELGEGTYGEEGEVTGTDLLTPDKGGAYGG